MVLLVVGIVLLRELWSRYLRILLIQGSLFMLPTIANIAFRHYCYCGDLRRIIGTDSRRVNIRRELHWCGLLSSRTMEYE